MKFYEFYLIFIIINIILLLHKKGKNMLIILSGCSGAGKSTIIKGLLQKNNKIKFMKTCTTRKKREGETDDSYIFVSRDDFDKKLKNGEIFEYEEIHKNFYGTLNSSLDKVIDGEFHYIKDVGVLGEINLKRALKNKAKVISIFLTVPKDELIRRLKERHEPDIDLRLSRMEFEMSYINNYNYVINNTNYEKTLAKIEKIIAKEEKTK